MNKSSEIKDTKIRLSSNGTWFHEGIEITHQRTIDSFFRSISFKDGRYYLADGKTPVPFTVDDVAFFVKEISKDKDGFVIKISDSTTERLNISTVDVGKNNALYCLIQGSSLPAKFERKVYYELMKHLSTRDGYYGIKLGDKFYPIQSVAGAKIYEDETNTETKKETELFSKPRLKLIQSTKKKTKKDKKSKVRARVSKQSKKTSTGRAKKKVDKTPPRIHVSQKSKPKKHSSKKSKKKIKNRAAKKK